MNSKQLHGLQVISADSGEKVGSVTHAYLDVAAKRLAGVAYSAGGGLLAPQSEPKVDMAEIHALGPDALILDDPDAARGAEVERRFGELVPLEQLGTRSVLTVSGTLLGKIASVDFDEHDYAVTQIEASPGLLRSNQAIPIAQVMTIGPDYVIVGDEVAPATASEPVVAPAG
jgi:uncharacterized protein YrrD